MVWRIEKLETRLHLSGWVTPELLDTISGSSPDGNKRAQPHISVNHGSLII